MWFIMVDRVRSTARPGPAVSAPVTAVLGLLAAASELVTAVLGLLAAITDWQKENKVSRALSNTRVLRGRGLRV